MRIEITLCISAYQMEVVVPHAGTRIEITIKMNFPKIRQLVVPHAGTQIEIITAAEPCLALTCRSPRGNVD